jgi:hypothetical protein
MPCRNVSQIRKTCTHSQFKWFCYRHGSEKTSIGISWKHACKGEYTHQKCHWKIQTSRTKKKVKKHPKISPRSAGRRSPVHWPKPAHPLGSMLDQKLRLSIAKDHPTRRPSYQVLPLRAGECLQILSDAIAEWGHQKDRWSSNLPAPKVPRRFLCAHINRKQLQDLLSFSFGGFFCLES